MVKTKKIVVLLIVLLIVFIPQSVFAYTGEVAPTENVGINADDTVVIPRGEITEWRYQVKNGVLQKRLWSITYNRWLTDWINC